MRQSGGRMEGLVEGEEDAQGAARVRATEVEDEGQGAVQGGQGHEEVPA